MTYTFFIYLLEATFCLSAFALAYRWFFSKHTHFHWMRFYLITSLVFSLTLPIMHVPMPWNTSSSFTLPLHYNLSGAATAHQTTGTSAQTESPWQWIPIALYGLLTIFLLGFLYKTGITIRNLLSIRKLIRRSEKTAEKDYWLVYLTAELPTFSFWHYIFLNRTSLQLPYHELQQVKQHELIHVRQKHTLDLLFFEVVGALFWFNPLMTYLKNALQEAHEYLADATVAGRGEAQKDYAHLLLKLSIHPTMVPIANSFSGKQISRRITMLTKDRSLPKQRFAFTLIFPMAASLLLLCSCLDEPTTDKNTLQMSEQQKAALQTEKKIGKISWEGNTVYSDHQLDQAFGLSTGDAFDKDIANQHLNYKPDGSDVSSLYMDHGYLFLHVDMEEKPAGSDVVDLVMKVYEGQQVKTGKIIIRGNKSVSNDQIRREIPIKTGELFSRSQLVSAQKALADMGYFDPKKIMINPIPDPEKGTVDIEFVVTELNK